MYRSACLRQKGRQRLQSLNRGLDALVEWSEAAQEEADDAEGGFTGRQRRIAAPERRRCVFPLLDLQKAIRQLPVDPLCLAQRLIRQRGQPPAQRAYVGTDRVDTGVREIGQPVVVLVPMPVVLVAPPVSAVVTPVLSSPSTPRL